MRGGPVAKPPCRQKTIPPFWPLELTGQLAAPLRPAAKISRVCCSNALCCRSCAFAKCRPLISRKEFGLSQKRHLYLHQDTLKRVCTTHVQLSTDRDPNGGSSAGIGCPVMTPRLSCCRCTRTSPSDGEHANKAADVSDYHQQGKPPAASSHAQVFTKTADHRPN